MAYCTSCGQMQPDEIRFCRFCGEQQPGLQLVARLRSEADRIKLSKNNDSIDKNSAATLDTLARLEELRRQADMTAVQKQAEQPQGR